MPSIHLLLALSIAAQCCCGAPLRAELPAPPKVLLLQGLPNGVTAVPKPVKPAPVLTPWPAALPHAELFGPLEGSTSRYNNTARPKNTTRNSANATDATRVRGVAHMLQAQSTTEGPSASVYVAIIGAVVSLLALSIALVMGAGAGAGYTSLDASGGCCDCDPDGADCGCLCGGDGDILSSCGSCLADADCSMCYADCGDCTICSCGEDKCVCCNP